MKGAHSVKKKRSACKIVVTMMLTLIVVVVIILFFFAVGRKMVADSISPVSSIIDSSVASQGAPANTVDDAAADELQIRETYRNDRFGFTVSVPVAFTLGSEIEAGSGVMLVSSTFHMTATVVGYDNIEHLDTKSLADKLWNKRDDSIIRAESDHAVIYQYDSEYEYFIWAYVGSDAINQMTIRYPLQDDNAESLKAAQVLMQGFRPGSLDGSR